MQACVWGVFMTIINGTAFNDSLYSVSGSNVLYGGDGDDSIYGGDGTSMGTSFNQLYGGAGNDYLVLNTGGAVYGGDGDDYIILTVANPIESIATSLVYGGAGLDTLGLDYSNRSTDLVADLRNIATHGTGLINGHYVTGVERIKVSVHGGQGNDVITIGDNYVANSLTVFTYDGDDKVYGGGLSDYLYGGAGADGLYGNNGHDVLYGGDGVDKLFGGEGSDYLYGGNDADTAYGASGSDHIGGGDGADKLYGGADSDQLYGEDGADKLFGGADNDTLYGGTGADKLYGDDGIDLIYGGADADSLYGGADTDYLNGDGGADKLYGGDGADLLKGGEGADTLQGDGGADSLLGGDGLKDVFVYLAGSDSGVGAGNRDTIGDFDTLDVISLKAIDANANLAGDQAFAFIGTAAFAVQDLGQVRYQVVGSDTLIQIENTGDGIVDMEILLNAYTTPITASDFIL
jgi:Ca2+-binding RTX toxin-like protein